MEAKSICEKLHRYIDTIEDKKAEAIYTLFEEEIEQDEWQYSNEFKAELDKRDEYYKRGGKMISADEADEQINKILRGRKNICRVIIKEYRRFLLL